jgi:nucleotide-binding universal stress UspA family protein
MTAQGCSRRPAAAKDEKQPMQAPKRILAPVDYSPISDAALVESTDLAKLFGSELVLVNVVPVIADLPNDVSLLKEGAYEDERDREAIAKLQAVADKIAASGVKAKAVIGRSNVPSKEILLTAQHENIDLIVIATHGMTGWREIAFGSVAEKVVQHATVPVLVLRPKAAAATT